MTIPRDRQAAEEAALTAWVDLARFRPGALLKPWFLAIQANECRSIKRGRWWKVLKLGELLFTREPSESSDHLDLQRALDRLPSDQPLILALSDHLDLSIEDVAPHSGFRPEASRLAFIDPDRHFDKHLNWSADGRA